MTNVKAYVLCKVSSGSEREACKTIAEYPSIAEVNIIYGEYDIIAKIQVENLQQLDPVIDKIRVIPSITFTSTMIVGREYKGQGILVKPLEP